MSHIAKLAYSMINIFVFIGFLYNTGRTFKEIREMVNNLESYLDDERKKKMTWNYRIIKERDSFSIREVFYDENGIIYGCLENSSEIECSEEEDQDPIETLKEIFKKMKKSFEYPILEYNEDKDSWIEILY